jgi:uncharacterized membrane protein (DUF106 family)
MGYNSCGEYEYMKEYDPETLRRLQKTELEILSDFTELCEKHHIFSDETIIWGIVLILITFTYWMI